ncbi:TetR/AcrR family transcriptional regulator [Pseudomonas aeruginosa]|uniref:TetR/AcrR family transcriptional regulator n=1 Tax=Pseudomonas aeruginosa TaxID=287 RepID=UPI0009A2888A|nr:TetR/AcrR family transcriptional regulator [Pseudomonas aeruginosa]WNP71129.1 TetR/AcrR family transcriptional regulator [Pseudomonas aeruginosa]HBP1137359.1 TetR/AcrR family transcriptional regulator [Pseudomonas aeruginosa]
MGSIFADTTSSLNEQPQITGRGKLRRLAMIEAASEAFLEKGFEGTTLDMVIEKAGGSRRTLYTYFGGKEGLFAAVVERMIEEIFDEEENEPSTTKNTAKEVLEYYGRKFITRVLSPRSLGLYRLIVAEAPRFPAIGKAFFDLGPEHSYKLLAKQLRLLNENKHTEEELNLVSCQFLEMLKADIFLKALSAENFRPTQHQLNKRLEIAVSMATLYLNHKNPPNAS